MVWPSEIEPGEIRWLYQTRDPGDCGDERAGSEGERPMQGNVEAQRAHSVGLIAQALHGESKGRADDVSDAQEHQHGRASVM